MRTLRGRDARQFWAIGRWRRRGRECRRSPKAVSRGGVVVAAVAGAARDGGPGHGKAYRVCAGRVEEKPTRRPQGSSGIRRFRLPSRAGERLLPYRTADRRGGPSNGRRTGGTRDRRAQGNRPGDRPRPGVDRVRHRDHRRRGRRGCRRDAQADCDGGPLRGLRAGRHRRPVLPRCHRRARLRAVRPPRLPRQQRRGDVQCGATCSRRRPTTSTMSSREPPGYLLSHPSWRRGE